VGRTPVTRAFEYPEEGPRSRVEATGVATAMHRVENVSPQDTTLVLTMPIAWKGTVVQYVGRLHRTHPAKRDIRIYDYADSDVPVLRRMYAKRLRAYRHMGYTTSGQLAVDLDATTID
jgi:hypothetical protein